MAPAGGNGEKDRMKEKKGMRILPVKRSVPRERRRNLMGGEGATIGGKIWTQGRGGGGAGTVLHGKP